MSKEPAKRETEQEPSKPEEGWKRGYSPQQIKIMEEARGEPKQPTPVEEKKEEGHRGKVDK